MLMIQTHQIKAVIVNKVDITPTLFYSDHFLRVKLLAWIEREEVLFSLQFICGSLQDLILR